MSVSLSARFFTGFRSFRMSVPRYRRIPISNSLLLMVDCNQCLLPASELAKVFEEEGLCLGHPFMASCGTSGTACILALGLHRLGQTNVSVYDGSWTEWGAHCDTPVSTC